MAGNASKGQPDISLIALLTHLPVAFTTLSSFAKSLGRAAIIGIFAV